MRPRVKNDSSQGKSDSLHCEENIDMKKKQASPRVIIIVGANCGIGYYMVKYLLEHGDFISVLDIELDNLKK